MTLRWTKNYGNFNYIESKCIITYITNDFMTLIIHTQAIIKNQALYMEKYKYAMLLIITVTLDPQRGYKPVT